jgi:hypothetical protein
MLLWVTINFAITVQKLWERSSADPNANVTAVEVVMRSTSHSLARCCLSHPRTRTAVL